MIDRADQGKHLTNHCTLGTNNDDDTKADSSNTTIDRGARSQGIYIGRGDNQQGWKPILPRAATQPGLHSYEYISISFLGVLALKCPKEALYHDVFEGS
jgi:hypothetical protein